jgi:hypothetical protein
MGSPTDGAPPAVLCSPRLGQLHCSEHLHVPPSPILLFLFADPIKGGSPPNPADDRDVEGSGEGGTHQGDALIIHNGGGALGK